MEGTIVRSAAEIARDVNAGSISAAEVTAATLAHAESVEGEVGSYLTLLRELAESHARHVDERVRNGANLPLAGVPIAVKDNMCLESTRTTCGSKILEHWIAPYTATAVARMLEAGAVPIGKANCDEFAMGSSCENSALGVTRNPYDLGRVPGGSSGGSAAAVGRLRSGDRPGQRYRRLDSRTRRVLQSHRLQTDLRAHFALRFDRVCLEPRSDRSAHAHGRRCRARLRRDGRVRRDGCDLDRSSGRTRRAGAA